MIWLLIYAAGGTLGWRWPDADGRWADTWGDVKAPADAPPDSRL